jgi:FlaA1/EpsC-like NDP-sugar epimerase
MEENPEEAVTNNVLGTRNVVEQALRVGTERLVLISTDKAVAPSSVMGATKRMAETIVRRAAVASGRAFVAVRFGNVLASRGSVVQTFKRQIEAGGPVTVTDPNMTRFFMTIPEAVHLVLQASGTGRGGELFVLDMGEPVRIVELARDLIHLSGLTEDEIPIVFTGIRPGEKMHEALCDEGMTTAPTPHAEVLEVVGEDGTASLDLDTILQKFEAAARLGDRAAIDALLRAAVPGYAPVPPGPAPAPASVPEPQLR